MKRGDLITVAMQGDFGKPRPALVIQVDRFAELPTLTVLPVSSALQDAPLLRVTVLPTAENGLKKPSQIMVDKAATVMRHKAGAAFGRVDAQTLKEVERCLAMFLGIAE